MNTDLIWVLRNGDSPGRYQLIDWSGRSVGPGIQPGGLVTPAFDGRAAMVDGSRVIDWRGIAVGPLNIPDPDLLDAAWADDNRHICVIAQPLGHGPDEGAGSLWLAQPGSRARRLHGVGQAGSSPGVLACSITNNRAVVASELNAHIPPPQGDRYLITLSVQVIDLTTGAVIFERNYAGATRTTALFAVASPEGRYLAENGLEGNTKVKEITSGRVVTTFHNSFVAGFSWDDMKVSLHYVDATSDETRVVDLANGRIIWSGSSSVPIRFNQRTGDFIAVLDDPAGDNDLLLVPQVGTPRVIARQVFVSAWCGCVGARI